MARLIGIQEMFFGRLTGEFPRALHAHPPYPLLEPRTQALAVVVLCLLELQFSGKLMREVKRSFRERIGPLLTR